MLVKTNIRTIRFLYCITHQKCFLFFRWCSFCLYICEYPTVIFKAKFFTDLRFERLHNLGTAVIVKLLLYVSATWYSLVTCLLNLWYCCFCAHYFSYLLLSIYTKKDSLLFLYIFFIDLYGKFLNDTKLKTECDKNEEYIYYFYIYKC